MTVIKSYNAGTSSWEVIAAGAQGPQGAAGSIGTAFLDDLSDVTITSVLPFQSINYDGTGWANDFAPVVSQVRNVDTVTLPVGTVVYLFGATGDRADVKRADFTSDVTSSKTIGVVAQSLAVNDVGAVVTRGYVTGVNLSAYTPGQVLYLNAAGAFTATKPSAPNHLVFVGIAVRCNANGIMYVATQNGYELDELHNVQASSPSSGDFLKYNGTLWVSEPIDLGADTVGNYVAGVTAGTGVTVTGSGSEGATPTVAIGQAVGTTSSPSFSTVSSTVATGTSPFTVASTTVVANLNADLLDGLHGSSYANQFTYSASAPSSPTIGQTYYNTSTGQLLVYYGATTGWRQPWNMPWGTLGQSKITSGVTSAGATVTSTGLVITTPSLPSGRILKWTVTGHAFWGSVNDVGAVDIYTGTSGGSQLVSQNYLPFSSSTTYAYGLSYSFYEITSSAATVTRRVVCYRTAGTSSNFTFFADAARPGIFICEDMGPSGNPPSL